MHEILFRGKRIDNGEWVEGNLFVPDKLTNREPPTEILVGTNVVRISYEVIPETVCQYTGLKDKNGKRIFEGDIMAFVVFGFDYVGSVEIVNGNASVMCKNARPYLHQAVSKYEAYIIGNIHDNLELLEGNVVCGNKSIDETLSTVYIKTLRAFKLLEEEEKKMEQESKQ